MNQTEIQTILDCLPKGKTRFYYYKDRYAPMLLSYRFDGEVSVSHIKKTQFARLLDRDPVKQLLQTIGSGRVISAQLESRWPRHYECYLLTLGIWGKNTRWIDSHYQATRCGYNLVLQLNFSQKHNRPYDELVQPVVRHPFEHNGHPIADNGYHTLAWSRLDINLDAGQALIEEIQNDWIRHAIRMKQEIIWFLKRRSTRSWEDSYISRGLKSQPQDVIKYVDHILTAHVRLWDEAMLAATLWFLCSELGIRTIYYHTFDSGNKLKNMGCYSKPPRSIYSELPKKFCFVKTDATPKWIIQNRTRSRSLKKLGALTMWCLRL